MDSKRYDYGTRTNTESSPVPSPALYSSSYSSYDAGKSRTTSRRSQSPVEHRGSRFSRMDSPERRRRKRSSSRSPPARGYRRSRSSDRDRERLRKHSRRDKSRSRSWGRSRSRGSSRSRGRSRSRGNSKSKERSELEGRTRSRGRSRSRDRRRSRSRNKSRDRQRFREVRKQQRTPYESDHMEETIEAAPPVMMSIPPPNAFKNDGSFMEMFKKMQEQLPASEKPTTSVLEEKPVAPPPLMVGKRRGGRILKTGMVAKPKVEQTVEQPKDAWSLYMAEVKKYREVCCQEEDNTRPLQLPSKMSEAIMAQNLQEFAKGTYKTTKNDSRFPNQNQTRHCYQYFVDFHRCEKARGKGNTSCQQFKRGYEVMCPLFWIERFDTQIAENRFPGKI